MSPEDIQKLIQALRDLQSMLGETDPATAAQIESFILILQGWLQTAPAATEAGTVLGAMLRFFLSLRIPISPQQILGQAPTYARMAYTVLIDRVVPGIARLIVALDAPATVFGLPLGGDALAVGAAAAFLVVALACFGLALYRVATTKPYSAVCGPTCGSGTAASGLGPVDAWQFFATEQRVFVEAMSKAQSICDTYSSNCRSVCSKGNCKPNVSLQDFEVHYRGVWTTVDITKFNCTCECLWSP